MPAANVIQLRQLLREKLPALRQSLDGFPAQRQNHWPTSLPLIDRSLNGGLPKGALTEVIAAQPGCGSALLLHYLLRRAASEKQIVALLDGYDSFDVTDVEEAVLSRLLWVRGQSAEEMLKAADLLLRDRNVPFVLVDLIANPVGQIRRIPATTWFRFQRIVEQSSTIGIVFTPWPMVSPAQARITLPLGGFPFSALDSEPEELLGKLKLEVSDTRRSQLPDELRGLA